MCLFRAGSIIKTQPPTVNLCVSETFNSLQSPFKCTPCPFDKWFGIESKRSGVRAGLSSSLAALNPDVHPSPPRLFQSIPHESSPDTTNQNLCRETQEFFFLISRWFWHHLRSSSWKELFLFQPLPSPNQNPGDREQSAPSALGCPACAWSPPVTGNSLPSKMAPYNFGSAPMTRAGFFSSFCSWNLPLWNFHWWSYFYVLWPNKMQVIPLLPLSPSNTWGAKWEVKRAWT